MSKFKLLKEFVNDYKKIPQKEEKKQTDIIDDQVELWMYGSSVGFFIGMAIGFFSGVQRSISEQGTYKLDAVLPTPTVGPTPTVLPTPTVTPDITQTVIEASQIQPYLLQTQDIASTGLNQITIISSSMAYGILGGILGGIVACAPVFINMANLKYKDKKLLKLIEEENKKYLQNNNDDIEEKEM